MLNDISNLSISCANFAMSDCELNILHLERNSSMGSSDTPHYISIYKTLTRTVLSVYKIMEVLLIKSFDVVLIYTKL